MAIDKEMLMAKIRVSWAYLSGIKGEDKQKYNLYIFIYILYIFIY